jgi:hypothetical protein
MQANGSMELAKGGLHWKEAGSVETCKASFIAFISQPAVAGAPWQCCSCHAFSEEAPLCLHSKHACTAHQQYRQFPA